MDEVIILRLLIVVALYGACLLVMLACRQSLPPGPRLAMDFSMAMYLVTFHAGSAWLYIWQDTAIADYFDGGMIAPRIDWLALLLLATLPLVLVPVLARLAQACLPGRRARATVVPVSPAAVWLGALSAIAAVLIIDRHLIGLLAENSLSDLASTSGLVDLYARRRELFETLSSIQAGLLYSTLPACAALLLFMHGRRRWLGRAVGTFCGAAAIMFNVGLFQIGPVLAFGVTLVFCFLAHQAHRVRLRHLLVISLVGMLVLGAYLSLKETDRSKETPVVLQLALRMPIALPYLFQMAEQAPGLVKSTDSLPHELGEFMFPELAGPERFVAMPQPAFINAWFQWGVAASLFTLVAIALLITLGGRLLDRARADASGTRVTLVSVGLAAALYYGFQVSLIDVLISSYGLIYVAFPPVLILMADHILRPLRSLVGREVQHAKPTILPDSHP